MPNTIIQAPQVSPPRHGIVDSAYPAPEELSGSDRWEMGFTFQPRGCDEPESQVIPCVGGAPNTQSATTENRGSTVAPVTWVPYIIKSDFKCDTQTLQSEDFEGRAVETFLTGESKLIETEFYRGDAAGFAATTVTDKNTSLVTPGSVNLSTGGATTPTLAIRQLIQAAAWAPGAHQAMLHATPATAVAWMQGGSIEVRNGKLQTTLGGFPVIVGWGYTGAGPSNIADADPNVHWAWVTSPVYLLRGPELSITRQRNPDGSFNSEIIDRAANDAQVIVRRTAAAYFDGCLHAGTPVDTQGTVV